MLIVFVVTASIVLQFAAAFYSLRLIKITKIRLPWVLISIAAFLMGVRRLNVLIHYTQISGAGSPDILGELLGLVISVLLLFGIAMIAPLIISMREHEEELKALSFTDELTDLYNRRGMSTLAEHLIAQADRTKVGVFLLYADIDNMKMINDSSGHSEGDQALLATARILKKTYRKADIIARVGGDEFVVVPVGFAGDDIEIIVGRLQKNVENYNLEKSRRHKLSLSVGVSYYDPESPCTVDELLLQGDRLMYEQKRGKHSIVA